jgi:hypothetical protein
MYQCTVISDRCLGDSDNGPQMTSQKLNSQHFVSLKQHHESIDIFRNYVSFPIYNPAQSTKNY